MCVCVCVCVCDPVDELPRAFRPTVGDLADVKPLRRHLLGLVRIPLPLRDPEHLLGGSSGCAGGGGAAAAAAEGQELIVK